MPPLMNYTTKIDPMRTATEVQALLFRHGARRVSIDQDTAGKPTGLFFVLEAAWGQGEYQLPVNAAGVHRALVKAYDSGNWPSNTRRPDERQAERVAWRICLDWIEAQLAVVEAGLVTADQALFPYLIADGERTTYERFVAMKMLPPGRPDNQP